MELEHRFELPVGVEKAFPALIDLDTIAPCWPGATLDTVSGDEFTGGLKIKIGRVPRIFKGTARFVEKDHQNHRAVIEATGAATRSGSSATMLVTATATALAPNRTAVVLLTTLSITGRESSFTRQVMVDVGNESIGRFADCMSKKLAGKTAGGATLLAVVNPDEVAADVVAHEEFAGAPETPAPAAPAPAAPAPAAPAVPRRAVPASEPVEVLTAAKGPLLQQVAPVVGAVILAVLILRKKKPTTG